MNDWLEPVRRVLDRSAEPVRFLFRDNNVGREDERLYEMLDVFAAHEIPIDLGVIPDLLGDSLARNLQARLVATSRRLALHEHKVIGRSFPARAPTLADHKAAGELIVDATAGKAASLGTEASAAVNLISSDVTEPPVVADADSGASPVRVDWCRHGVSEKGAAREILGRHIAVAASRRQPIEIVLNHARISGSELVAIEELLLLLANHRKAQCLLMRELTGSSSAHDMGQDVAVRAPTQAPEIGTSAARWWPERFSRTGRQVRWLWLVACVAVAGAIGWYRLADVGPGSEFLTARVLRGSVENTVLAAGTLQPYAYVDVGAQTSGQLKSLHVQLGDKVKKGQLLAEIDPLISASKVAEATATLANLQAQWEGKKAQFELARLQKSRSDDLLRQGAQATSDSEIAESNYKLAHSALQALEAQIKQARAELETAQVNLAYTRITAPMNGEVISISALQGQTLNATQQAPTILRIAQLDTMTVWALVPEADVSRLTAGQDVYFTILGRGERRWHGRLRQILPSPQVIANVVFYNALFDVPNPQRELKVQMTAQVFFVLAQANDALYVPLSALGGNHSWRAAPHTVRVLRDDGSTETRKVEVGITNAISAQILAGLSEGDTVITGAANVAPAHKASPLHSVKPPR
jgi:macrolide-specific efflux system membrane fusion protein